MPFPYIVPLDPAMPILKSSCAIAKADRMWVPRNCCASRSRKESYHEQWCFPECNKRMVRNACCLLRNTSLDGFVASPNQTKENSIRITLHPTTRHHRPGDLKNPLQSQTITLSNEIPYAIHAMTKMPCQR